MLLYAAPSVPLAQPRNLIGGQLIGSFVGVVISYIIPASRGELRWLSSSLAVSLSIVAMQLTKTLHPPGKKKKFNSKQNKKIE